MAGTLDEVSSQIGELTAIAKENQRQCSALFKKLDEVNREQIEQAGALRFLGQQFTEHKAEDKTAHAVAVATAAEVEAVKNKGKGFSVGLALVGGGGGIAGFLAALQALFGHGGTPAGHP